MTKSEDGEIQSDDSFGMEQINENKSELELINERRLKRLAIINKHSLNQTLKTNANAIETTSIFMLQNNKKSHNFVLKIPNSSPSKNNPALKPKRRLWRQNISLIKNSINTKSLSLKLTILSSKITLTRQIKLTD